MSENYLKVDVEKGYEDRTKDHKLLDLNERLGVKALACKDKDSLQLKITSYLFDVHKGWTDSKAARWVEERKCSGLKGLLKESFSWLQALEPPNNSRYIKIVALNAGSTLNRNLYLDEELMRAARTLIGKPVWYGPSHDPASKIQVGAVEWAEYEDRRVECLASVNEETYNLVKNGEILHSSIEANYLYNETSNNLLEPKGLIFTGILLLPKDVQPGDPNTSVTVLEKLQENLLTQTQGRKDLGGLSKPTLKEGVREQEESSPPNISGKPGVAGSAEKKDADSWGQQLSQIAERIERLERILRDSKSSEQRGKGIVASPSEAQDGPTSGIPSLRALLGD
jgi:hypothetical protein